MADLRGFLWILALSNYFNANFDLFRKYFISSNMPGAPNVAITISIAIHFVWCYLLIIYFDLGLYGAAFSILITDFTSNLICYIIIKYNKLHDDM